MSSEKIILNQLFKLAVKDFDFETACAIYDTLDWNPSGFEKKTCITKKELENFITSLFKGLEADVFSSKEDSHFSVYCGGIELEFIRPTKTFNIRMIPVSNYANEFDIQLEKINKKRQKK